MARLGRIDVEIICCIIILSCFCVGDAVAQPKSGQVPRDIQSTYEPRSDPATGQRFLAKFVGDWDIDKTFYPRSGEPARTKGECHQTMIHGGRFLKSEFLFERDGSSSTGTGIVGFEAESGKFTSVWIDSRRTAMSMRQSRDRFDGNEIVLYSTSLGKNGGGRVSRTVTRLEDDGRKIVHKQYATGPDGRDRLVMELVMSRKLH